MARPTLRTGLLDPLLRLWYAYPYVAYALRAALAASGAWLIASSLPDPAGDYPYYAPFGAVIATSLTLADSVRASLRGVAAIAIGGLIAFGVKWLPDLPNPLPVGLAVALGVVAGRLPLLGAMGTWVPTAALFTLIIGHGETGYIGVYAGLSLLGACVGIVLHVVLPPMPLVPARNTLRSLRGAVAAHLEMIADHFESQQAPFPERARQSTSRVNAEWSHMRAAVDLVGQARRGNVRSRWLGESVSRLHAEAEELDRLVVMTFDLGDLLLGREVPDPQAGTSLELRREFWPPMIESLRRLAEIARTRDEDHGEAAESIEESLRELTSVRAKGEDPSTSALADAVVIALRRGLRSLS